MTSSASAASPAGHGRTGAGRDGDLAGTTSSGPASSRAAPGRERAGERDDDLLAGLRPADAKALLAALREADRLDEVEDACEAFRRGGVQGLCADQGRTVATRFLELRAAKR
jgi:hypothetical protein